MDWFTRMKNALELMEENLEEQLDITEIAKAAYSSPFHFQRMFHMLTGMTVAEYSRKRKLTLAAQELAISTAKVVDVAFKYGYDSPESFSKAFRKIHGVTPSEARNPEVSLKAFPRISFQLSLKGDLDMDYRIIEKDAFPVIGKSIQVSTKAGENFRRIPEFWRQCHEDGTAQKLCSIGADEDILGICMDMEHSNEEFTYLIAVKSHSEATADEFVSKVIPASSWAVFTSIGPMPGAIQNIWQRVFQEWFPATGYEHSGGPDLEVYPPGDPTTEDYRCEVWVPIVKK
ncbi:AraC family transcriptional regulator [Paenibacillus baekrokdamisoli]|uniref:AraC family transcriptional regulator n=1 Tax=Paenibacillus baekrokdamisoli TaxID=1712516 RepID=A0A3G9IPW5_9BACL|nr:effector binding domain-containing protein [Paenibacillus baekrokdamisoli]MBB3072009.1 AraC family transcriptional regulator [Paenibacillus baekrokdamisoli]BBH20312.1 AraC family transcriptional regulator [Paenibacillus baekrokdamisoli]